MTTRVRLFQDMHVHFGAGGPLRPLGSAKGPLGAICHDTLCFHSALAGTRRTPVPAPIRSMGPAPDCPGRHLAWFARWGGEGRAPSFEARAHETAGEHQSPVRGAPPHPHHALEHNHPLRSTKGRGLRTTAPTVRTHGAWAGACGVVAKHGRISETLDFKCRLWLSSVYDAPGD